jgi:tetratricopeptide (TPR) repeat protein
VSGVIGVTLAVVVIGLPAMAFAVWPLLRRAGGGTLLPLPLDAREQLAEDRRGALRTLRELEFEHAAGHVSDADYADLRARYEADTAVILTELDRLGAAPAPASTASAAEAPAAPPRAGWRHPVAVGVAAVALVTFGVGLGVGIVRYTEPDPNAGAPMPGSRPLAGIEAPSAANAPRGPVTPEMLQGMLQAARASLFARRYNEAIAAYQAVLKRDPDNVDATTHLGLIAAIAAQGEHGPEMVDRALGLFDRALERDPNYAPALLYRGQVLLEVRKDVAGAITSWEKFVAVAPPGEDRDRVAKMLSDARAQAAGGKR